MFGIFMGVPTSELDTIDRNYGKEGNMRCLVEMYKCIESMGLPLSWEHIVKTLEKLENHCLAHEIRSKYIPQSYQLSTIETSSPIDQKQHVCIGDDDDSSETDVINALVRNFISISEEFTSLTAKIKIAFKQASVDIDHLQDLIKSQCGLEPLPEEKATIDAVFGRLRQHYSILDFRVLTFLVEKLLKRRRSLQKEIADYANKVDQFKSSAKMIELVDLIKAKQTTTDKHKTVKVRVSGFLSQFTIQTFEITIKDILRVSYKMETQISIDTSRNSRADPHTTEEQGKSL